MEREIVEVLRQEKWLESFSTLYGNFGMYSRMGSHEFNEDAGLCIAESSGEMALGLVDGMGGHAHGDIAAELLIKVLKKEWLKNLREDKALIASTIKAIENAHAQIKRKVPGAGAAMAMALIRKRQVRILNIGDVVGWLFSRNGDLKYETTQHSPIGYAVESGLIEKEISEHHEESHFVLNALGHSPLKIEMSEKISCKKGDMLLLATDGFYESLTLADVMERVHRRKFDHSLFQLTAIGDGNVENIARDDASFMFYRFG